MAFFRKPPTKLNLALQGGGAHGAFTWGVLDRLLEDGRLQFDTVSGTSAGAVNAVAFAAGYLEGGPDGARAKLTSIWEAINKTGIPEFIRFNPLLSGSKNVDQLAGSSIRHLTNVWSPYHLNPLAINPLKTLLQNQIDFEALAKSPPFRILIAATNVATGLARVFRDDEISVDTVLASACLPTLHHAVKIGEAHYWDGGFSANPDLVTLSRLSKARDTLLVVLNPVRQPEVPTTAREIAGHIARLTFNQPFLRDIALLDSVRRADVRILGADASYEGLRRQRFHLIAAGAYTSRLSPESKLKPDWALLTHLHVAGRTEADRWLGENFEFVGREETADLVRLFLRP